MSTVKEPFLLSSLLLSKDKAGSLEQKAQGLLLKVSMLIAAMLCGMAESLLRWCDQAGGKN
jgi:hypothetical protein